MDKHQLSLLGKCIIFIKLRRSRMEIEMREVNDILKDLKAMEKKNKPEMEDGDIFDPLTKHMDDLTKNFGRL